MRAVVAAVAILAILASPSGLGAFLPGDAGPTYAPSPVGPTPPSPHLFAAVRPRGETPRTPVALVWGVVYYCIRGDEAIGLPHPRSGAGRLSCRPPPDPR